MQSVRQPSQRSALGTVVGAVLSAASQLDSDPISAHYGVYPNPIPTLERIAHAHGWTLASIITELETRSISAHWQYVNGIGYLEDLRRV